MLVGVSAVAGSALAVGGYFAWGVFDTLKTLENEGFVKRETQRGTGPKVAVGERVNVVVTAKVLGEFGPNAILVPETKLTIVVGGELPDNLPYPAELSRLLVGMRRGESALAMFKVGNEKRCWDVTVLS